MKAMNCLLVSLVAGTCATSALAQQDQVLEAHKIDRVRMMGNIGGGFNTRAATVVDYYSNVDTAPGYIFYSGTATAVATHLAGEHLFFEKGGFDEQNNTIGPVGSATKVGVVEFWTITLDASQATGTPIDCTVTLEMFDHCLDWLIPGTAGTCTPSGDDSVAQTSVLGGAIQVDLTGTFAPQNGYANGYVLNIGAAGFAWNVPDGNGFYDIRLWEYNGGSAPTTISLKHGPAFDGQPTGVCSYPAGGYPAFGYSVDNFYTDSNGDGRYQRNERFYFNSTAMTAIANLMVRLSGDDGCSFDINGDGFVGGSDIDYSLILIDAGCPY